MTPIFPIAYFGSILYFQELVKYDTVFMEAKEHFPKQTLRNRCEILSADGPLTLSIPIKRKHRTKTFTENITLSDQENWRIRHWRAIKTAYQSAPFFDYYGMEVEELLFYKTNLLFDFNIVITQRILKWLDIEVNIKKTETFAPIKDNEDFRVKMSDKSFGKEREPCPYIQVFPEKNYFSKRISILDAIFCEGPLTRNLLIK